MKIKVLLSKIIIPGFQGQSLYDVSMFFYKGLLEGAITTRASALAFNFFLALFPSIIVIFTLIPFVPIDGFQEQLFISLGDILPSLTFEATKSILDEIKGIGSKNKKVLLRHFGGLESLRKASIDQIESIEGIGSIRAKLIYDYLNEK